MNRAEKRRQRKQAEKAARVRGRRIKITPIKPSVSDGAPNPDIQSLIDKAVQAHQAGQLPDAEAIYRKILTADPEHPEALGLLGTIALVSGQKEQAVEMISAAIAVKPDYAEAHSNLGAAFLGLQRHEEALARFDKALALNPGNASTQTGTSTLTILR